MTEVQRIASLLKHGYDGTPWYGTPLRKQLGDVTAQQAAGRPIPRAHTIWQVVLHVIAWRQVAVRLLAGETADDLSNDTNWPEPPTTAGNAAWEETLDTLARTQGELTAALEQMSDDRLREKAPGKRYSLYALLHGIIHHDAYHAGQIALLRNQTRS
jgi:uncharacterized damage-inducible protein DinB